MTKSKAATGGSDTANAANPFAELSAMFGQFKVPGIDMPAIADGWRKDVEALMEANRSAHESMQAMTRRQTEMLSQAMQRLQDGAKKSASVGAGDPAKQAELARDALQQALVDMKELGEMFRKAQTDAMSAVTQRANQHMQEIRQMLQPR